MNKDDDENNKKLLIIIFSPSFSAVSQVLEL